MHFMGQQAISRATRATRRLLISLSFVVWFIRFYDVSIDNLEFYNIKLPTGNNSYYCLQQFFLIYSLLNHFGSWFGDYISYKSWNVVPRLTSTAGFGSDRDFTTKLDSVIKVVEEKIGTSSEHEIMLNRFRDIKKEIVNLNSYAGLYIWVWHLFVPIIVCLTALLWPS